MVTSDFVEGDEVFIQASEIIVSGLRSFIEATIAKAASRHGRDLLDFINVERAKKGVERLKWRDGRIQWDISSLLWSITRWQNEIQQAIRTRRASKGITQTELEHYIEISWRFAESAKLLRDRGGHTPRTSFSVRDRNRFLDLMEHFLRIAGINIAADKLEALYQECLLKEARRKFDVKRLRDPEDKDGDLRAIFKLEDEDFDLETIDAYEDMKRWLGEINDGLRECGPWKVDEVTLALKRGTQVIGYLFAQHYVNWKTIFISHLGYDRDVAREAAYDAPLALLSELIEICNDPSRPPWEYVVGEVEETKKGKKDRAYWLFVDFQRYSQLINSRCRLFMLDFEYIQPAVKPEDMDRVDDLPQLKQRLLLFVRDPDRVRKNSAGEYWLDGKEAVRLFDFVVSCLYAHGFLEDEKYQKYLADFLAKHVPRLENGVRLIADGKQTLRMLRS